jgi:Cu(I)/Ag(I) efflux system membrane fusion protein
VVVALGEGRFRAQPVQVGIESGDRVAIVGGLSAGDRVVTSAQFLIDSESNIDAALARLEGQPQDPEPARHEHDAGQSQQ